jgi:hypothetical protein
MSGRRRPTYKSKHLFQVPRYRLAAKNGNSKFNKEEVEVKFDVD